MSDETVKYLLDETQIPTHWMNMLGELPGDPLPPLHPGTLEPAGPDDLAGLFPMGLILQEVSPEPLVEIPERGSRRLQAVATDAALPGSPARTRSSTRQPTSTSSTKASPRPGRTSRTRPCRRPTKTPRPATAADHRDRRRAVGLLTGVRLLAVRARVRGVHGRLQLRPEALPPLDDADLGRDRASFAEHADRSRPRQHAAPDARARWGSRSPRPSRSPRSARHQLRARLVLNHVCCTRR